MKKLLLLFVIALSLPMLSFSQNGKNMDGVGLNNPIHPSKVSTAVYFDEIPSLMDLPTVDKQYYIDNWGKSVMDGAAEEEIEINFFNWKEMGDDPVWQRENGTMQSQKALLQNFAGQDSPYLPSDCNGTVGPNHYMQTVNTTYAIWDKTGTQVVSPTAMNTLFSGVTGSGNNDGDPLILFDEQADKWVAVEFSLDKTIHGGTYDYMLVAVSQTNDPTGAWWRWSFTMDALPDYEKMGIWHDGYYMGTNLGSTTSTGDDVYVFERSVMIAGGASPQQIQFHNSNRPNNGFHCIMPLDADGASAPTSSPGQFITINDDAWGGNDEIRIYELNPDWGTPSNSTFSMTQQISVPAFDSQFNSWGTGDIDQQGTSQLVDAQPYVLMVRGQYKNWGTNQSIVCVHTVDVDGSNHAGERWYELEKTSQADPSWAIRQNGTYAPDANSRWMGSIAINDNHQIAMGYSISSTSMSPNIRYCGQSSSENASATGVMDIAESADLAAGQSQDPGTSYDNRWGDYSLMTIDPNDGTTFWYTTEYWNSGSKRTRIVNFTLGAAVLTASFSGSPTNVSVGNTVTYTDASFGPNPITSWNWSFPGGTPSSATGQGPHVITYNTVGTFDASLTVGDGSSTDDEVKNNYIAVTNCTVSSYPWFEGFENSGNIPDCWDNEYVTDTQDWSYQAGGQGGNPGGAHSGSYNAYLYNPSSTANVTKLVSPQFDMSGLASATLTFWHTQAYWNPDQDELRVYYKTSSGGSWTLLATYTNDISSWTQETLNLSSLTGDYYLAFEGTAKYGHGVCVDDVEVDGVSSAPVAAFSADDVTPNVGQTVTFTDASTNTPTSWSWSFSPATVTYVGGTSSTSQNPQVTFDAAGTYDVTLTATNGSGSDDEVKVSYITASTGCTAITSYPYVQNFDSWTVSSPAYSCTADGSINLADCWTNVTGDDIDWDILSGATGSSSTGPTSDHTGSGNYLYTESSSCYSKTGYITSPEFDLTSLGSATLTFWYHMYGGSMGTLSVQVSTNGGSTWSADLWSLSGDQGNSWQQASISLDSYVSFSGLIIRFTGLTGGSYTSDMAIDDVEVDGIIAGPANNTCAGATAINEVTDLAFDTGSGATASGVQPSCGGSGTPPIDLWYAYTATVTGDATIDLCGSSYDTRLTIWDACGGTQIDCNDDGGPACSGLQSSIAMYVVTGTTYYIQVGGYSTNTGTGDLTIVVSPSYLWEGNTSTDWDTGSNWSGGLVPNATQDVAIPTGVTNWPTKTGDLVLGTDCNSLRMIDNSELTITGNLSIPTGYTFTNNSSSIININGNMYAEGVFDPGTGIVNIVGNSNSVLGVVTGESLTTTFAGGNGAYGNMFDIVALNDVTIESFEMNLNSGTGDVYIYYKSGTYVGSETTSGDWTLVGSTSVTSSGSGSGTAIPIPVGVNIPSGQTFGFYIHAENGNAYTNGTSVGNVYVQDANIQILEGCGKNNPLFGGTFQPRVFNGVVNYYYGGSGSSLEFYNLAISKPSSYSASIVSDANIANDLTVDSGASLKNESGTTTTVSGNATFTADASGMSSFIQNGTFSVSGTVDYQQYLTQDNWHQVASPISSALSGNYMDIYLYDWSEVDSLYTWHSVVYYPLALGEGYYVWNPSTARTVHFDGAFNNTDFNKSLSYTPASYTSNNTTGYNLVGNPFPSYLTYDNSWSMTNVDATFYVMNSTTGNYVTMNPSISTEIIPPTQGFFVKANASGASVTIPAASRTHTRGVDFYKDNQVSDILSLEIIGNGSMDKISIITKEDATYNFDSQYDAYDLRGLPASPQLYMPINGIDYSMNVIPNILESDVYPIAVEVGKTNQYEIKLLPTSLSDEFSQILLEDLKTQTTVNLNETNYLFVANQEDDAHRFNLRFSSPNGVDESLNSLVNIFSLNNTIFVQTSFTEGEITVYDMLGQEINTELILSETTEIEMQNAQAYYLVEVKNNEQVITKKVYLK